MSKISPNGFHIICHPLEVTPMALAAVLRTLADTPPGYADTAMGEVYRATRKMPALRKVRTWDKVHEIFDGKDEELIDELASIVTTALERVITPELKKEMHEGFVKHMQATNATTKAEMKIKAESVLASLSDEDAQKVLDTYADPSMSDAIEELRKARFPSV